MSRHFDDIPDLAVTDHIVAALAGDGIVEPTPVQDHAIPAVLSGRHVVIHSGTGTGKTLAYLLPVLQRLREDDGLRAVVFAPGVELAMQTLRVADRYKDPVVTSAHAVSTSSQKRQRKRLQKSTRLVVGTPDRLIPLFKDGKLKKVRLIVLDELDPILAGRESEYLKEVLSRSEPKVQLVVATATLGPRSVAFLDRFVGDEGVLVRPERDPLVRDIAHHVVHVGPGRGKDFALARFIEQNKARPAIVFVSDTRLQGHLFRTLGREGLRPVTVTREGTKAQRQTSLDAFRAGTANILLTTDDVARGLDIPDVAWVLHYDLPRSAQAYVHRAGRTGRAGRRGTSVIFADGTVHGALRRLARELALDLTPFPRRGRRSGS